MANTLYDPPERTPFLKGAYVSWPWLKWLTDLARRLGAGINNFITNVSIDILPPNVVVDLNLAPTSMITQLTSVPSNARAWAPGYLRNEGTAGIWYVSIGGNTPSSNSYSFKLGPGDSTLNTMGEGFKEAVLPIGSIKVFHDSPGVGGAGRISGFASWNDGTSSVVAPTGPVGPYGGALTFDYKFDGVNTANSDPGSGLFRLNNATQNIATALYVNTTSYDGANLLTILGNLTSSTNTPNKAIVRIVKKTDVSRFLFFYIRGYTTHTGYKEYAITAIVGSSASPFSNNDECLLCVTPIGDKGADGANQPARLTCGLRLTLATGIPHYCPTPQTASSTDTAAETVTLPSGHGWITGTSVTPISTLGGLTTGTRYFVNVSTNTVSFHTTVSDAFAGINKVNLTASVTQLLVPTGMHNTQVYFTPDVSTEIGLYDGSQWTLVDAGGEISIALGALTNNTNYDLFAVKNGTLAQLELGAAWSGDRTRSTALTTQNGVFVKSGDATRRYIGTLRTNSTTTTCDEWAAAGMNVTADGRYLYNEYNQRNIGVARTDGTSHSYTSATVREWNAGTNSNRVKFVVGRDQFVNGQIGGYVRNVGYLYLGLNAVASSPYPLSLVGNDVAANLILCGGMVTLLAAQAGYNEFVPSEQGGGASGQFERYFLSANFRG